jgi:hypothetical protein
MSRYSRRSKGRRNRGRRSKGRRSRTYRSPIRKSKYDVVHTEKVGNITLRKDGYGSWAYSSPRGGGSGYSSKKAALHDANSPY